MNYKFLPDHLRTTADAVAEFLKNDRGVKKFVAEEPVDPQIEYRPTLHGVAPDHYIVAVEVQENADTTLLDSTILTCVTKSIPLKLFVVYPEPKSPTPHQEIKRARDRGVGVIEMQASGPVVLQEAFPLSLLGYRLDRQRFPSKYRSALLEAENTFRDGSPAKGCSIVYDEIEHLSRTVIKKTKRKRMWRKLKPNEKKPKINLDTGAWEKVMEVFEKFFVRSKFPKLSSNLVHRIAGITAHRNQAGHKPTTGNERVARDREIRTRFEAAADLLYDLIHVARELK